jgi:hypothetical protein
MKRLSAKIPPAMPGYSLWLGPCWERRKGPSNRTPVRAMRPPQFARDDDLTRNLTAVKVAIKHLAEPDPANLLAWLLLYYQDNGAMFNPQISRRRKRIAIDGVEHWLVRVPERN